MFLKQVSIVLSLREIGDVLSHSFQPVPVAVASGDIWDLGESLTSWLEGALSHCMCGCVGAIRGQTVMGREGQRNYV